MALEQHTQLESEGYVRLVPGLWGKPRLASLLRSYLRECQKTENEAWEFFACVDLLTAPEWALLRLGKLIGQARHALTLDQFRLAVQARALANRSSGLLSDLFAVLNVLLGALTYSIEEPGNATLWVSALDDISDADAYLVAEVLPFARAGGVGLHFLYSDDATDVFRWGDAWGAPETWGTVRVL